MWLVKQAASKVKSLGQQVLREKGQAVRLAEDIVSSSHQVMPVRKMGELAALSFNIDHFQQTVDFIAGKLADIKFERKSLKKRLNLLVLSTYLIKHGASGFIDQFRTLSPEIRRYQDLRNFIAEQDPKMRATIEELRERATYLLMLLTDKAALLREKEVARLIREKLFLQGGDFSSQRQGPRERGQHDERSGGMGERVQSFLEHYVWRYTQKLDKKLDQITDILIAKIDLYLDGEMPEEFEIEEAEGITTKPAFTKSEFELGGVAAKQQQLQFMDAKLLIKQEKVEQDLLKLSQSEKAASVKADLLVFEESGESMKENLPLEINKPEQVEVKAMDDDEIQAFRSELAPRPL